MRLLDATGELVSNYVGALRAQQALAAMENQPGTVIGPLVIDHEKMHLRASVSYVQLPRHPYALLCKLGRRPGQLHSKSDLIAAMYAHDPDAEPDTAEVVLRGAILWIRERLALLGGTVTIRNERDSGYAIEVARG